MSDLIKLRLEISRQDLAREKKVANGDLTIEHISDLKVNKSASIQGARFVEAVLVIATTTLAIIAKRIVEDWLKNKQQGVQIDLRTTPPTISNIANVPRGFIVVIDKEGNPQPYKAEYEKGEDLMPVLSHCFTKG